MHVERWLTPLGLQHTAHAIAARSRLRYCALARWQHTVTHPQLEVVDGVRVVRLVGGEGAAFEVAAVRLRGHNDTNPPAEARE